MKRLRVISSILAILFGLGAAVAGQLQDPTEIEGFEYVPSTGQCRSRMVACDNSSSNLCTWAATGNPVGQNTASQCGPQLKKP